MAERVSGLQREIMQSRPFVSPRQEAAVALLRTADVVKRRLAALIEPRGITLQQFNVLRILRGSHPEPLPTLEIGERLIERMPGVTRLIDRLEEKGLVSRERSLGDRRLVHCRITDEGLAQLAPFDTLLPEADETVVGGLLDAEVETMIALLEKIRAEAGA